MKTKVPKKIAAITLFIALCLSIVPPNAIFAAPDAAEYVSRLPVIYIKTDDGKAVTSKEEYKSGTITVQSGDAGYSGKIQIKGRGNVSWGWPKKPYRIKLDKKADLLGLGENKNWVLISNYLDECFLRNKTAYDLSERLGLVSMNSTWCDVVFNGEYAGCYLLCEQIRIDKTRVDIFDWESEAKDAAKAIVKAERNLGNVLDADALEEQMKTNLSWITDGYVDFEGSRYSSGKVYDNISGGYLFELSNEYDEVSKFTTNGGLKVMINSPEYLATNGEMTDYVIDFWNSFEDAIRSEDGYTERDGVRVHYTELADLDSLVSYWLVMEIMGNVDAAYKSRYAYMDMDSLLTFGPAWDFDWGSGSSAVAYLPTGWKVTKRDSAQCFFNDLVDDPLFIAKASEKYAKIRPYLQSLFEEGGIIDSQIEYLAASGAADEARWDRKETWPEKARGFSEDARLFKEFMERRIAWLDRQFATDGALIKSTNSSFSSYPYVKSDDKITFELAGVSQNGTVADGLDVMAEISVNDEESTSINVYINGLSYGSFELSGGKAAFTVESDELTEQIGKKNVISVIAKDALGGTTYKNFLTVTKRSVIPGDANGDGELNMKDVLQLRRVVAGIDTPSALFNVFADINSDGTINMKDILKLRRVIAGLE